MNKLNEFYVSVDIEAVGPIPGEYSMSSLGAFVAGARTVGGEFIYFDHTLPKNVFYRELRPLNNNYIRDAINIGLLDGFDYSLPDDNGSRKFQYMQENGASPELTMRDFADFVMNFKRELNARPIFMAYPASFDWTFVYWYFQKFSINSPFGFSGVLDLKTYYSAKYNQPLSKSVKRNMPKSLFPSLPHTHKADDDAIEQGIFGMNMLKHSL